MKGLKDKSVNKENFEKGQNSEYEKMWKKPKFTKCQIQDVVIWIAKVIYSRYMISVPMMNVNV